MSKFPVQSGLEDQTALARGTHVQYKVAANKAIAHINFDFQHLQMCSLILKSFKFTQTNPQVLTMKGNQNSVGHYGLIPATYKLQTA